MSQQSWTAGAGGGWRTTGSRGRLATTMGVGVAFALGTGLLGAWSYAPLVGWDAAAGTFSAWVWATIAPMEPAETKRHARREDPGQAGADTLVLLACLGSLAAIGAVLVGAHTAKGSGADLLAGLALISVALSWFVVHTLFTLRYARIFHAEGGGVDFNQEGPPRYIDFAYVAFTIGMTFQVSDAAIRTTRIRGAALRHAMLSYFFGAVVMAATVNLVVSITTSGG